MENQRAGKPIANIGKPSRGLIRGVEIYCGIVSEAQNEFSAFNSKMCALFGNDACINFFRFGIASIKDGNLYRNVTALIGILTVSDTRKERDDSSGPAVADALGKLGFADFTFRIVRDELPEIQGALIELCETCAFIFTTGGTGFTPRDVTPEATAPLLEKRADSLVELMRLRGLEHTPLSHLSRGVAGVRGSTLIVNLPGSPKGARQGIEALAPLLPGILGSLQGDGCPH